jgi:cryptochrome
LEAFLADKARTATFSKPASAPTSLEPSTTQLSPYLKFGCLSVRAFYWRAKDIIDTYQPKKGETVTKEPENLLGQVC